MVEAKTVVSLVKVEELKLPDLIMELNARQCCKPLKDLTEEYISTHLGSNAIIRPYEYK